MKCHFPLLAEASPLDNSKKKLTILINQCIV